MLNGFSVNGFRSFTTEQWAAPLTRVTVFIGKNNSGKSNILRYLAKVVDPALRNSTPTFINIDKPVDGNLCDSVQILVKDDDQLRRSLLKKSETTFWSPQWDCVIDHFKYDESHIKIPFYIGKESDPFLDRNDVPKVFEGPHASNMWSALTNNRGGNSFHWYNGILERLRSYASQTLKIHYIRSFRNLPTRLEEFVDEYGKSEGPHLIDEISRLDRPGWDRQEDKEKFNKLRDFIRTLLENPNVNIEVSSDKTHIVVNTGNDFIPLEALGSGVHEVFMLAAEIILRDDQIILLDEPETHLHPTLQKRLMEFIVDSTSAQVILTTHSSSIIDNIGVSVFSVAHDGNKCVIEPAITDQQKYLACRELGYRPSEFLQSNCVIWIEGPSDRIYLNSWIKEYAPELRENIHYSFSTYGGRVLSHFSAVDTSDFNDDDLIKVLSINRNCAILLDSDIGSADQEIRATKKRLIDEVKKIGGLSWLTEGREIENYYSIIQIADGIKSCHRNVVRTNKGNRFRHPLLYWVSGNEKPKTADKIKVARWLVSNCEPDWNALDLGTSVQSLIDFIKEAN